MSLNLCTHYAPKVQVVCLCRDPQHLSVLADGVPGHAQVLNFPQSCTQRIVSRNLRFGWQPTRHGAQRGHARSRVQCPAEPHFDLFALFYAVQPRSPAPLGRSLSFLAQTNEIESGIPTHQHLRKTPRYSLGYMPFFDRSLRYLARPRSSAPRCRFLSRLAQKIENALRFPTHSNSRQTHRYSLYYTPFCTRRLCHLVWPRSSALFGRSLSLLAQKHEVNPGFPMNQHLRKTPKPPLRYTPFSARRLCYLAWPRSWAPLGHFHSQLAQNNDIDPGFPTHPHPRKTSKSSPRYTPICVVTLFPIFPGRVLPDASAVLPRS